jgi:hypothetical protein
MSKVVLIIFVVWLYAALPALVIVGWVRWVGRRQAGDTWLSLTGFSLGTASALLAMGTMLYARSIGGFPFYDLALFRIYRSGLLLSVSGLIFAVVGLRRSSPVRWYAPAVAAGTLLFWLAPVAAE